MRSESACKINSVRVAKLVLSVTMNGPSLSCEAALLHEGKDETKGVDVTMGSTAIGIGWSWPEPVVKAAAALIKEIETALVEIYFGEKRSEKEESKPRGIVFSPADQELESEQL